MLYLHDPLNSLPYPVHRRELSYFGVKVAMIEPGYFVTNMTQGEGSGILPGIVESGQPRVKELYGENFPADRE